MTNKIKNEIINKKIFDILNFKTQRTIRTASIKTRREIAKLKQN